MAEMVKSPANEFGDRRARMRAPSMGQSEASMFSWRFTTPIGEPLLVSAELAERLPELVGMGWRDIRSAFGSSARTGKSAPQQMTMTDDGLAIISAIGPMFRYDDICAWLFDGCVTDVLMDQFDQAMNDPSVRGVMLFGDSPGGEAAGIHDLGDMIYQMRDQKPVVAYVDNLAASAMYWTVSGANQVVVSPASFLGSIGVVTTVWKDDDEKSRTVEIVSSKSPNKRPKVNDPDGRAQIQARVDDLADVFISTIAKHRGVSPDTVETDFGQGGVLIGQKAVDAGMADQVGDSAAAFAALRELVSAGSGSTMFGGFNSLQMEGSNMAEQAAAQVPAITTLEQLAAAYPALVAQIKADARAEGATAERDRIQAIDKLDTANNRAVAGELISTAKWDGKTSAETLAFQILTTSQSKAAAQAQARQDDGAAVPVVQDQPGQQGAEMSGDAIAAQIAAMANERRGHPAGTVKK